MSTSRRTLRLAAGTTAAAATVLMTSALLSPAPAHADSSNRAIDLPSTNVRPDATFVWRGDARNPGKESGYTGYDPITIGQPARHLVDVVAVDLVSDLAPVGPEPRSQAQKASGCRPSAMSSTASALSALGVRAP